MVGVCHPHQQRLRAAAQEAININKSLSALGDVIMALHSNKQGKHVPYRNSKLTRLLSTSLGGESKVLMFLNVPPTFDTLSETITSLRFGQKVNSAEIGVARSKKELKLNI